MKREGAFQREEKTMMKKKYNFQTSIDDEFLSLFANWFFSLFKYKHEPFENLYSYLDLPFHRKKRKYIWFSNLTYIFASNKVSNLIKDSL